MNKYSYIGFTSNSTLTKDGRLVMGAGNAKYVRDLYQGIDKRFGTKIKKLNKLYPLFGVMFDDSTNIFAFQSKTDWKSKSTMKIIEKSLDSLYREMEFDLKYALPIPGIQNGKLNIEEVLSLIKDAPDNIDFYRL